MAVARSQMVSAWQEWYAWYPVRITWGLRLGQKPHLAWLHEVQWREVIEDMRWGDAYYQYREMPAKVESRWSD